MFTCSLPDGFYQQQQQFYGGYPPRGGGRGFGNPGMYYGRGGGNTWRDRGPARTPTNGEDDLYFMLSGLNHTLVINILLSLLNLMGLEF